MYIKYITNVLKYILKMSPENNNHTTWVEAVRLLDDCLLLNKHPRISNS